MITAMRSSALFIREHLWPGVSARQMSLLVSLVLACLMSTIALITVKDQHRQLVADIEMAQMQLQILQADSSQQLLEKGTLLREDRVAVLAKKLGFSLPGTRSQSR